MKVSDISTQLGKAGLELTAVADRSEVLVPPNLAGFVKDICEIEADDLTTVEKREPDLQGRINESWYRLAGHGGLFESARREFYVAVDLAEPDGEAEYWWARVVLRDVWDLAGAGAATGVLGNGFLHPAFVMLSLDGESIVRVDEGELVVELALVRNVSGERRLREHGVWMLSSSSTNESTRSAIRRWLDHHGGTTSD